jgi:hypothetical protein
MNTVTLSRSKLALVAVTFSVIMLFSMSLAGTAAAQGIGYQYDPGARRVILETPTINVHVSTGGNVPHFMFWDPNFVDPNTRLTYHVQFYQLIEFNDSNGDGSYTNGTDWVMAPILGLGRVAWDFSGFLTEENNSQTTAVHFNFTLDEVQGPGIQYDDFYMELRCHINTTNDNELKFDIVISGWPWVNNDTHLALRWDLMVQSPGTFTYRHAHQYRYENQTFAFDGAYFAYQNSANVGNDTIDVTSSYENHPDKTMFYLTYENFGDEVMVHDPLIGLDGSVIPPDALLPTLIVIGAGALACVVIGAAIWTRRRNVQPTSSS